MSHPLNKEQTSKTFISQILQFSPWFSLLVPGTGQLIQKRTLRGMVALLLTFILIFLMLWGNANYGIGNVALPSGRAFNWLWIAYAVFHLWNVLDAFEYRTSKKSPVILALVSVMTILMVVGWVVTDVKMDRLITRFGDAGSLPRNWPILTFLTL
jgi:succinate dehydrogenase hydrophobic anchor subunit